MFQNISLAEGGWSFLQPLPSYLPWFPEILGAYVSGCPDSTPRPYCVGAWSFLQFSPLPKSEQPRETGQQPTDPGGSQLAKVSLDICEPTSYYSKPLQKTPKYFPPSQPQHTHLGAAPPIISCFLFWKTIGSTKLLLDGNLGMGVCVCHGQLSP